MLFVPKLLETTFLRGKYFNAGKSEFGVMSTMMFLTFNNTLKISLFHYLIIISVYCVKVWILKYYLKFNLKIISTKPNQNGHHVYVVLLTFGLLLLAILWWFLEEQIYVKNFIIFFETKKDFQMAKNEKSHVMGWCQRTAISMANICSDNSYTG